MIPQILEANTYWWTPQKSAGSRRTSEALQQRIVKIFLDRIGLESYYDGHYVRGSGDTLLGQVHVSFYYEESCKHVYKRLTVERDGKKSNLSLLKKLDRYAQFSKELKEAGEEVTLDKLKQMEKLNKL